MMAPRIIFITCTLLAAARFFAAHLAVSRKRTTAAESGRRSDPRSMLGLVIESVSFLVAYLWPAPASFAMPWRWLAAALAVAATALVFASVSALGKMWRVQAVVTDSHELITHGPYRFVRHPIYLAVLVFLIAFGLMYSSPRALLTAIAVCIAGTEMRVRAEDALLRSHFGEAAIGYQRRVAAYLPGLR